MKTGVDADAAVVIAVIALHSAHQRLAVGVGFKVKVVAQVHGHGRRHIGLDAALGSRLGHGLQVCLQAGEGGDAGAKALGDGEKRRSADGGLVHLLLPGIEALREAGALIHLVAPAPEDGVPQVGVAVDEAGEHDHARGFNDLLRLSLRGLFGEVGDFAVLHAHKGVGQHRPGGIHGHRGDMGKE